MISSQWTTCAVMGPTWATFVQFSPYDNLVVSQFGTWPNFALIEPSLTVELNLKKIYG